jgi:hypothetical protein
MAVGRSDPFSIGGRGDRASGLGQVGQNLLTHLGHGSGNGIPISPRWINEGIHGQSSSIQDQLLSVLSFWAMVVPHAVTGDYAKIGLIQSEGLQDEPKCY